MTSKIIYFGASWCGQCQVVKKHLEKVTEVPVEKCDVETDEAKAEQYNIKNIPTLIFVNENGETTATLHGAVTLQTIKDTIGKG